MWRTILSGTEGFTDVKYGKNNVLAAASWDNNVYLFNNGEKSKFTLRAPALSLAFGIGANATHLFSGGAEQHISVYDASSGRLWDIGGEHNAAISSVECIDANSIVSGGYDAQIQHTDTRSDQGIFYRVPHNIIDMSYADNTLFVAMTDKLVNIYDLRQLSLPLKSQQMQFKHPIKAIQAFEGGRSYCVSSVCSRVAYEYLDNSSYNFAFRAHQSPTNTFMVNCLATRDSHELTTGGADRTVQVWDCSTKSKLYQYPTLPMPVQNLSYSGDGKRLAVGVADDTFTRTAGVGKVAGQLLEIQVA